MRGWLGPSQREKLEPVPYQLKRGQAVLRDCEKSDIPAITAIYGHAVRHSRSTFEIDPPKEREMAVRREALVSKGYPYIVAVIDDALAGYAYASPYRPRPAYDGTVEDSVYVHKDFRGQGLGRSLLQRLIADAEVRDFRQMVAVIGDSTNAVSIRLHESLGFALVGTFRSVGWKHEQWLDTVLMQRALGLGDTAPPVLHETRER